MWEKYLAPELADKHTPGWRDEPGRLIPPMRLDDLKALCANAETADSSSDDAGPRFPTRPPAH